MQFPVNKLSKRHLLAIKQPTTATATDKEAETCPSRDCPFPQKPSGPGLCRGDHTHTHTQEATSSLWPQGSCSSQQHRLGSRRSRETSMRCKRWQQPLLLEESGTGDNTGLLSAALVGGVTSPGPTALRSPFPLCQDAFLQLSLLSCPLVNDHSSFPHSFIQFLLFNILITGLTRPTAPSPLNEKQKGNLTWLFSQLVPTPPHPPQLSRYDPSKTVRLCCLTPLAQKGPRYLSAALRK